MLRFITSARALAAAMLGMARSCDEVFCDDCHIESHKHGKRASHRWIGFAPGATPCFQVKIIDTNILPIFGCSVA